MIRLGRPRKGEEGVRRDQLLERAIQLFAEHGYANLSVETIAREARVSLRTIYRQYGGKAELFGATIRHISDLFVAALPTDAVADPQFEEALVEFGKTFISQLTRPELIRLRAQLMAEAHRFPDLAAEWYIQGPERTLDRLARFFAFHQNTGRVMAEDPLFLAGQFLECLKGERFQRLQLGLETTPAVEEIEPWVRRVVALFLRGCLTAGPAIRQETT